MMNYVVKPPRLLKYLFLEKNIPLDYESIPYSKIFFQNT